MQRRWLSILGAVLLVPLMALALIGAAGVLDYRPSWSPFTQETSTARALPCSNL